jgi:hypothetical protein
MPPYHACRKRRFTARQGALAVAFVTALVLPVNLLAEQRAPMPRLEIAAGIGCPLPMSDWNTVTNPGFSGDFIAGFHVVDRLQVGGEAMLGYPSAAGLINMPDNMDIDWRIKRFGGYARYFFALGEPWTESATERYRFFVVADAGQYRIQAKVILDGETVVDESESAFGMGGGIGFQAYHYYQHTVKELRLGVSFTVHYMPLDGPESFGMDAGVSGITFAEVTINVGVAFF